MCSPKRAGGVRIDAGVSESLIGGPGIKLADTPASIRTPPARFGEHTEEVLGGLGFGAVEIARLRREGVV